MQPSYFCVQHGGFAAKAHRADAHLIGFFGDLIFHCIQFGIRVFLAEFAKENQRPLKPLTDEALKLLLAYPWPGNVRELRTAIEHGVVMSNDPQIDARHLPDFLLNPAATVKTAASSKNSLDDRAELNLHVLETNAIHAALAASSGNRTHAAELLGLSRRTLQRKLRELGL